MSARFTWPAEWTRHDATWIAWPHHEADWPGNFAPIPKVYADIVHALHAYERVEILINDEGVEASARTFLDARGVPRQSYRFHRVRTDRSWLRDSGPTGVHDRAGNVIWLNWAFNAWAKYDNFDDDARLGATIAETTSITRAEPLRPDSQGRLVLEGGGIETDGAGTLLVTEEWLLTEVQVRNPGLDRDAYERAFREWLGITKTIWLGEGCVGDDTHGHIDDVARFTESGTVLVAHESDPSTENYRRSAENIRRLELAKDASGNSLRVVTLPLPREITMEGVTLPASYANFYVANGVVLVPTFDDPNDHVALGIISGAFPGRDVAGIPAADLVWGLGTIHCLTQQQPAPRR